MNRKQWVALVLALLMLLLSGCGKKSTEANDSAPQKQAESAKSVEKAPLNIEPIFGIVDAGLYHSVGIRPDGTVMAIGCNKHGECDVNDWEDIIQVSASYAFTVGLRADQTVVATGQNDDGQCNVDEWHDIIAIATGNYHTVGLRSDGTVVATGDNSYGQCDLADWTGISYIDANSGETVGLKADGTVLYAGHDFNNESEITQYTDVKMISVGATHIVGIRNDGTLISAGGNSQHQRDINDWTDVVAIAAGYRNTVGLKSDGTLLTVGENVNGELDVTKWSNIISIATGSSLTLGITTDGTVLSAGSNDYGWRTYEDWTDIVDIDAGYEFLVGLGKNGKVYASGRNEESQCDVGEWKDIKEIRAGRKHTLGLKSDGTVVATGDNEYGQCNVGEWKNIIAIAAANSDSYGLTKDGNIVCTDYTEWETDELQKWFDIEKIFAGDYTFTGIKKDGTVLIHNRSVGMYPEDFTDDIIAMDANYDILYALDSEGHVRASGSTSVYDECLEEAVFDWGDIVSISAGSHSIFGVKKDGSLVGVVTGSDNDFNECNILHWTDMAKVARGDNVTVGLKKDGTVVASGFRYYGEDQVQNWKTATAQLTNAGLPKPLLSVTASEVELHDGTTFTLTNCTEEAKLYIMYNLDKEYTSVYDMTRNGDMYTYTYPDFMNAGEKTVWVETVEGIKSNKVKIYVIPKDETLDTPACDMVKTDIGKATVVSWSAVQNADGYAAYLYKDGIELGNISSLVEGTGLTYTFTDAGLYTVQVQAYAKDYNTSGICVIPVLVGNIQEVSSPNSWDLSSEDYAVIISGSQTGTNSITLYGYIQTDENTMCTRGDRVYVQYWLSGSDDVKTLSAAVDDADTFEILISGLSSGSKYCFRAVFPVSDDKIIVGQDYEVRTSRIIGNQNVYLSEETLQAIDKIGETVTYGHYEQDADSSNGKEPIEWIVLDVKDNKVLLISKYGLDAKMYHNSFVAATWETCSLRSWLNNDFMNEAFSKKEKANIVLTDVDNSKKQGYSMFDTDGGNATQDKLFLLSYSEVYNYFGTGIGTVVHPTDYAIKCGAGIDKVKVDANGLVAGYWWLRSPGHAQDWALDIDNSGFASSRTVTGASCCVRPALWIDLGYFMPDTSEEKQTVNTVTALDIPMLSSESEVITAINGTVCIAWNAVDGAERYALTVYNKDWQPLRTENGVPVEEVTDADNTKYTYTFETCGEYYIKIFAQAVFENGTSTVNSEAAIVTVNVAHEWTYSDIPIQDSGEWVVCTENRDKYCCYQSSVKYYKQCAICGTQSNDDVFDVVTYTEGKAPKSSHVFAEEHACCSVCGYRKTKFVYELTWTDSVEPHTNTYDFCFDEAFFAKPASRYNNDLALLSMGMVLAVQSDGTMNREILEPIYTAYGFSVKDGNAYTAYTHADNDVNQIMSAMSRKIIEVNGEEYTLIAVNTRGGGYDSEWVSNLDVGGGDMHRGFSFAASCLWNNIKDFAVSNDIDLADDKVKIWITGFSRSAAVSNYAGYIVNTAFESYGKTIDDVYVYTFATPSTVITTNGRDIVSGYENIWNIVSPDDLVPALPLKQWKYAKYGNTITLPLYRDTATNEMIKALHNVAGEYSGADKAFQKYWADQAKAVEVTTKLLSTVIPRTDDLDESTQKFITDFMTYLFKNDLIGSYDAAGQVKDEYSALVTALIVKIGAYAIMEEVNLDLVIKSDIIEFNNSENKYFNEVTADALTLIKKIAITFFDLSETEKDLLAEFFFGVEYSHVLNVAQNFIYSKIALDDNNKEVYKTNFDNLMINMHIGGHIITTHRMETYLAWLIAGIDGQ